MQKMKWWGWGDEHKKSDISNMPNFMPFVEQHVGIDQKIKNKMINYDNIVLNERNLDQNFFREVLEKLSEKQIFQTKHERLIHSYGKSFRDLFRIRQGQITRSPDLVIYPYNHADVEHILSIAKKYQVCVIPFGGGTNIVGSVEAMANEKRIIISLDLSAMNNLIAIDPIAHTATFECGITGPELETKLAAHGFTLGHFPDSFEYSTLGGWIATRSVGMQSDQRGTISDMLQSIQVVTPQGTLITQPFPHTATGPDLNQMMLGSEGTLGVITQATLRIHPKPQKRDLRAVLFPNFEAGLKALYACAKENCLPHTMRLQDVAETQLAFSFKEKKSFVKSIVEKTFKSYIHHVKKIDFTQCCLSVLCFDGNNNEIKLKRKKTLSICKRFGGVHLGVTPGRNWYAKKYDYPYLRDLIMDYGCVVDVAETATAWSNIQTLYQSVVSAIHLAMEQVTEKSAQKRILKNKSGYVGCHISHSYFTGACLYFTFAFVPETGNELESYLYVKKAATDAIVAAKGTPSHHHSVGYEHSAWLNHAISDTGVKILSLIKASIDPQNIMNPNKVISL